MDRFGVFIGDSTFSCPSSGEYADFGSSELDFHIGLDGAMSVHYGGAGIVSGMLDMLEDGVFDVMLVDRSGREVYIRDVGLTLRLRAVSRIPRKMKKALKRRYGDLWLQHHPNVETVGTFSKKD